MIKRLRRRISIADICDRVELLCDEHEVELDEVVANAQFIASELPAVIAALAAMRETEVVD